MKPVSEILFSFFPSLVKSCRFLVYQPGNSATAMYYGQSENCNTQKQKNVNLTAITFIKNVWGNWRLNSPKMHWHFCYKNILLLLTQAKNLAIGVIMKFEFWASCEGSFWTQTRILMNKNYEEIKGPKGSTRECK